MRKFLFDVKFTCDYCGKTLYLDAKDHQGDIPKALNEHIWFNNLGKDTCEGCYIKVVMEGKTIE